MFILLYACCSIISGHVGRHCILRLRYFIITTIIIFKKKKRSEPTALVEPLLSVILKRCWLNLSPCLSSRFPTVIYKGDSCVAWNSWHIFWRSSSMIFSFIIEGCGSCSTYGEQKAIQWRWTICTTPTYQHSCQYDLAPRLYRESLDKPEMRWKWANVPRVLPSTESESDFKRTHNSAV